LGLLVLALSTSGSPFFKPWRRFQLLALRDGAAIHIPRAFGRALEVRTGRKARNVKLQS
jgi:hypothetical protein